MRLFTHARSASRLVGFIELHHRKNALGENDEIVPQRPIPYMVRIEGDTIRIVLGASTAHLPYTGHARSRLQIFRRMRPISLQFIGNDWPRATQLISPADPNRWRAPSPRESNSAAVVHQ